MTWTQRNWRLHSSALQLNVSLQKKRIWMWTQWEALWLGLTVRLNYGLSACHPEHDLIYRTTSAYFTCTCVGIHPGRVEPASPTALTTSRTEALQARRSCASSLDTFTQSFRHRAWPKTRGPKIGSRSTLIVVAHVFSWPPAGLCHVRGGVGRRRSLISPPSGRLAACPNHIGCCFWSHYWFFLVWIPTLWNPRASKFQPQTFFFNQTANLRPQRLCIFFKFAVT